MAEAITLGRMTDTMEEGFIADINVKVGDTIKTGDNIADVETDKATLPLESYYAGTVLHIAAKKGDSLQIGGLIAVIGKPGEDFSALLTNSAKSAKEKKEDSMTVEIATPILPTTITSSDNSAPQVLITPQQVDGRLKASPLAKAIAKEKGIDISQVNGSGEEGRIVKRDVESVALTPAVEASTAASISSPNPNAESPYTDTKVSQMRKTIAKRLTQSKNDNPHFYLTIDILMDKSMAMRSELNGLLPSKVSFNDMVIKAVALSLRQHPAVNTSWMGDMIRTHHAIHIGMAVAVEEGLLVPVIRNADNKGLADIAAEAKQLADKAKTKKLSPAEMEGSTFTISNLGMLGIEEFTAIINEPNACILAIGSIRQEPAVINGEIKIANKMKVTLSSDHRVVDGAVGARFLQTFKSLLEEPIRMLA